MNDFDYELARSRHAERLALAEERRLGASGRHGIRRRFGRGLVTVGRRLEQSGRTPL